MIIDDGLRNAISAAASTRVKCSVSMHRDTIMKEVSLFDTEGDVELRREAMGHYRQRLKSLSEPGFLHQAFQREYVRLELKIQRAPAPVLPPPPDTSKLRQNLDQNHPECKESWEEEIPLVGHFCNRPSEETKKRVYHQEYSKVMGQYYEECESIRAEHLKKLLMENH